MKYERGTREAILSNPDIVEEEVDVDAWKISILVKSLNGLERAKLVEDCTNKKGKMSISKLYPALMVAGCVDPKFTPEDASKLNEKNSGALEQVCSVIMRLSGIARDDIDDEEEDEEGKN